MIWWLWSPLISYEWDATRRKRQSGPDIVNWSTMLWSPSVLPDFPPLFFPISYLHTCISPLCSFLFPSYIFVMAGKYRLKRCQRHNGPRLVYTYLIKWLPNSINNHCPNINFIITQSRQYLQKRWLLEPETDVQSKPSYCKLGIFNNQSHLSPHFWNTTEERPIAPKAMVILCN